MRAYSSALVGSAIDAAPAEVTLGVEGGEFLGEGPHEPIVPRRWTTSAGIDGVSDLGLVLGHIKQRLFLRGHARPIGGGGVGGHIGHEHRSPRGIPKTSRRVHHLRFDRRSVGFWPRGSGYHRRHRRGRGDRGGEGGFRGAKTHYFL